MTPNIDLFDENVPEKLQKKLLTLVFESCKSASEHCFGSFSSRKVAKDVSGVYRRASIEDQWEGIPALFRRHVTAQQRQYKHLTGSYCELTCGAVRITQSCVLERGDVPREALYRETLATNGQLYLFLAESQAEGDKPRFLYSILTYGIDVKARDREAPAFIKIEFPNAQCTAPVDEGINLIKRFPEVSKRYLSTPSFEAAVVERIRKGRRTA